MWARSTMSGLNPEEDLLIAIHLSGHKFTKIVIVLLYIWFAEICILGFIGGCDVRAPTARVKFVLRCMCPTLLIPVLSSALPADTLLAN